MQLCDKHVLSLKDAAFNFEAFRQNCEFCDVEIRSENVRVEGHQVMLAAASPYFESIFSAGLRQGNRVSVNVPDISPNVLPSVLKFLYTGRVIITPSTAWQLLAAGRKLGVECLVTGCTRYLKTQVDTSNALSTLRSAEELNNSEVTEYTLAYIGDHWAPISQGDQFLELSVSSLTRILSSEKFAVANELEVVLAVVRWLEHAPSVRAQHCAQLLRLLRLGRVPRDELEDVWSNVTDTSLAESLRLVRDTTVMDARARGCNSFYIVGYSDCGRVFKYDIYQKNWEDIVPMESRRLHPGVAALGGRLYAVGGYEHGPLATGAVYDPATKEWVPIAPMLEARSHFALVALGGRLYALGGRGTGGALSSVEAYDPAADQWSPAGTLPLATSNVCAVAYKGALYVAHDTSMQRYEPSADGGWRECAAAGAGHGVPCGGAVLGDKFYVASRCGAVEGAVECYDFDLDRWEAVAPRAGRGRCALGAAGDALWAVGKDGLERFAPGDGRWARGPDTPHACDVAGAAVL